MTDLRRRRRVVGATAVTGASLLGVSLSTKPGSKRFYGLTMAVAGVWAGGAIASGPIHRGREGGTPVRAIAEPIATGAATFAGFYAAALAARRIPPLNRAIASILQYAHEGTDELVYLTALTNGAAEELFFRGALYDAAGSTYPLAKSTAAYVVATTATRNPALVLASGVMGALFAWQRKQSGGVQAPLLTHLTWSALMLRFLPPLFRQPANTSTDVEASRG